MDSLIDILQADFQSLRELRLRPVDVAILDSGLNALHPTLAGAVKTAWMPERTPAGDILFRRCPADDNDLAGHGTAVASIIRRIAPNARLHDIRVLEQSATGSGDIMLAGLRKAIDSKAKIINMSLVCLRKYQSELAELCEKAYQNHQVVIAAKRNIPKPGDLGFPAELSSCISVDSMDFPNPYCIGYIDQQPIEFAACGQAVLVANSEGGFCRMTGTSYATPTVSAIVALLLGKYPELDVFELKAILKHHSIRRTFWKNSPTNPLETSCGHDGWSDDDITVSCGTCGTVRNVDPAFSFFQCPACHTVNTLHGPVPKPLLTQVMAELWQRIPREYLYHNARHTREVLANALAFAEHYQDITPHMRSCLATAALLHDYGYTCQYNDNESVAAEHARQILPAFGFSSNAIGTIAGLILATAPDARPKSLLQQILRDADTAHIGTGSYLLHAELLRSEREFLGSVVPTPAWVAGEIAFLRNHRFHQPWLEEERIDGKRQAIAALENALDIMRDFQPPAGGTP